jgi:Uma2 family endonuclease
MQNSCPVRLRAARRWCDVTSTDYVSSLLESGRARAQAEGHTILMPRADFYRGQLAVARDVLFVVEVSDTTLAFDGDIKIPLYARHGITEAWLVDKQAQSVSIFLDP